MPGIDSQIAQSMALGPQALQQRYAQTQQLVDLLALQKLKKEKDEAARAIQASMQTNPATVKDQLEQGLMQAERAEVGQAINRGIAAMAPGVQMQGQRMAQAQARSAAGIPQLPSPNMARMAGGGIVAFQEGGMADGFLDKLKRFPDYQPAGGVSEHMLGDVAKYIPDAMQVTDWWAHEILLPRLQAQAEKDPTIREQFNRAFRAARDADKKEFDFMGSRFHTKYVEEMAGGGIVAFQNGGTPRVSNQAPMTTDPVQQEVDHFIQLYTQGRRAIEAAPDPESKARVEANVARTLENFSPQVRMRAMQKLSGDTEEGMYRGGRVKGYAGPDGSTVRGNNPFNIRQAGNDWEGEVGGDEFVEFESPEYGVRAADRLLQNYYEKHGIDTVRDVISRYAPATENRTEDYIRFVSERAGIPSESPIDLQDPETRYKLLSAMGMMESGYDMTPEQIAFMLEGAPEAEIGGGRQTRRGWRGPRPVDIEGAPETRGSGISAAEAERQMYESLYGGLRGKSPEQLVQEELDKVYTYESMGIPRPEEKKAGLEINPMDIFLGKEDADRQRSVNEQVANKPKREREIDWGALAAFLSGGAGQTSTAGALAGGAKGWMAEKQRREEMAAESAEALADRQLKQLLAEYDLNMENAKLLTSYQNIFTKAELDVAAKTLENIESGLNTAYMEELKALEDTIDDPVALAEAEADLIESYVSRAVSTVRKGTLGASGTGVKSVSQNIR